MRESIFQQELLSSLKRDGHASFKIPDMICSKETRFIPSKPYDIHATINGLSVGIECKMLHNKTLDNFTVTMLLSAKEKKAKLMYYEGNQYTSLLKLESSGGRGFVLLNNRLDRLVNTLYIMTLQDIDIISMYNKTGMTEHIKKQCYYGTGHHKQFDLDEFYGRLK